MAVSFLFSYEKIGFGPTLVIFLMKNRVWGYHRDFTYEHVSVLAFDPVAPQGFGSESR